MYLSRFLSIHALWVTVSSVMQPYPLVWGHYDVCKTQIYTEEGKVWDYMACQPESTDMTKYLKVKLDPPDITCGDPPEAFCAMVRQYFCVVFHTGGIRSHGQAKVASVKAQFGRVKFAGGRYMLGGWHRSQRRLALSGVAMYQM